MRLDQRRQRRYPLPRQQCSRLFQRLVRKQMGHHPHEQHRKEIERGEHRHHALPPLRDARDGAADQPEQHGQPHRHQPPVIPDREQEPDDHYQEDVARLDVGLAPPHRLPQQKQPEVRQQERARPPIGDSPRERSVQREQHEPEPPLPGCSNGRGGCDGGGAHPPLHRVPGGQRLSLYFRREMSEPPDQGNAETAKARLVRRRNLPPHPLPLTRHGTRAASHHAYIVAWIPE